MLRHKESTGGYHFEYEKSFNCSDFIDGFNRYEYENTDRRCSCTSGK